MALPNTNYGAAGVRARLRGVRRLFFIGIGGIHMEGLARMARARGFEVAGSDRTAGAGTERLRDAGIPVFIGHDATHPAGAQAVVYTLALDADNPEYAAAGAAGLPRISRADFLAYLADDFPNRIGVAGSHGKSTVTAMLAAVFARAGRDPAVLCGAPLPESGRPEREGRGSDFLYEACEYRASFLCTAPTLAVLLNAGFDHVDCYESPARILDAFSAFASLPGSGGVSVCGIDDPRTARPLAEAREKGVRVLTFGRSPAADCHPAGLSERGGFYAFTPVFGGRARGRISLRVPGLHNVENALAAAAVAAHCGIADDTVAAALSEFAGAGRRMEYRGRLHGARVYDDYAHHPEEVSAVLHTARRLCPPGGRLIAVFQSHTYSRTAAFFVELCRALRDADLVLLVDIYPARERATRGMSGAKLADGVGKTAQYTGSLAATAAALAQKVRADDLVLVMGAGDVGRIFDEFSEKDFTPRAR